MRVTEGEKIIQKSFDNILNIRRTDKIVLNVVVRLIMPR